MRGQSNVTDDHRRKLTNHDLIDRGKPVIKGGITDHLRIFPVALPKLDKGVGVYFREVLWKTAVDFL